MPIDTFEKAIRSLQVFFPGLVDLKAEVRYQLQHTLRVPHEADFSALSNFRPQPDEMLVDVGANRGQSIESILIHQPKANIVAFEPNPCLWPCLKRRYDHRSNIQIHLMGLSDNEEFLELFVPVYRGFVFDGLASVEYAEAYSWLNDERIYGFSARHLKIEKYKAQLVRLDTLQLRPAFIKIDVQGMELKVVKGGLETIRKHLPVLLIESVGPTHPISVLLRELGYHCYAFRGGKLHPNERGSLNSFLINPSISRFGPELFA